MNELQKPVLDFLGLGGYFDPRTGKFIRLSSHVSSSDEAKVNKQLTLIEGKNGQYAYLANRVREAVSSIILRHILQGAQVYQSEIKNDILYHTDAILIHDDLPFAIDFSTDMGLVSEKMSHIDALGKIGLISPGGQKVYIPFLVVVIASHLIDTILSGIQDDISHGLVPDLISERIGNRIDNFYARDLLPRHIVSFSASPFSLESMSLFEQLRLSGAPIYTDIHKVNPPPSR